jgi:hypothetical protein
LANGCLTGKLKGSELASRIDVGGLLRMSLKKSLQIAKLAAIENDRRV